MRNLDADVVREGNDRFGCRELVGLYVPEPTGFNRAPNALATSSSLVLTLLGFTWVLVKSRSALSRLEVFNCFS